MRLVSRHGLALALCAGAVACSGSPASSPPDAGPAKGCQGSSCDVKTCQSDGDCAQGACVSGVCQIQCAVDSDCGGGRVCTTEGACVVATGATSSGTTTAVASSGSLTTAVTATGRIAATASTGTSLAGSGATSGTGSTTGGVTTSSSTSGSSVAVTTSGTSSGAVTTTTGGPTSTSSTSSGGTTGSPLGASCTQDSDCASDLCMAVELDLPSQVCVQPCAQQSDCAAMPGFFCDPGNRSETTGYCVPPSPAHCLSCTTDSDCGSLSEVCVQTSGDTAPACHVDCSIAGGAACPPDYSCQLEQVSGTAMELCVPTSGVCVTSEGGFCDGVSSPQPCAQTNASGTCAGERTCGSDGQFTACSAPAPACLSSCSATAPTGCTESDCAGVASTPQDCGTCGDACPGVADNGINDNVTCSSGTSCTFDCMGENYDVDANPADGCEVADSPQGNHVSTSAISEGSLGSCDGSSSFSPSGLIPSDAQVHENPSVAGFDPVSGSAPDWFTVVATGAGTFCVNDAQITLQMNGSLYPTCYELTFYAPPYPSSSSDVPLCDSSSSSSCYCTTDSTGQCQNNPGDNSNYNDGDTLYWIVSKICSTSSDEAPSYSVSGHL